MRRRRRRRRRNNYEIDGAAGSAASMDGAWVGCGASREGSAAFAAIDDATRTLAVWVLITSRERDGDE